MTEALNQARNIARCVDISITVDADTGYGNVIKVMRATREFEATCWAKRVVGQSEFYKLEEGLFGPLMETGKSRRKDLNERAVAHKKSRLLLI